MVEVLLGELNLGGAEIFFEVSEGGGAWDEDDVGGAVEEPSEGERCGGCVQGCGEGDELGVGG